MFTSYKIIMKFFFLISRRILNTKNGHGEVNKIVTSFLSLFNKNNNWLQRRCASSPSNILIQKRKRSVLRDVDECIMTEGITFYHNKTAIIFWAVKIGFFQMICVVWTWDDLLKKLMRNLNFTVYTGRKIFVYFSRWIIENLE